MITKALKIFDNPKTPMETDTAEFIKPLIGELEAINIIDKMLTLTGCMKYCFNKGKKFEIKSGNAGTAAVTQKQHFEWCTEYFGLKMPADINVRSVEPKPAAAVEIDFDSLFGE